jgi:hypothetical protein
VRFSRDLIGRELKTIDVDSLAQLLVGFCKPLLQPGGQGCALTEVEGRLPLGELSNDLAYLLGGRHHGLEQVVQAGTVAIQLTVLPARRCLLQPATRSAVVVTGWDPEVLNELQVWRADRGPLELL